MKTPNNIYKLFSDCIPVKGKKRSIIYDMSRSSFKFIPNDLFDFLRANKKGFNISKLKEVDYFHFLLKNEFIFECTRSETSLFKKICLNYESPYLIESVVLELCSTSNYINNDFFKNLDYLGCIDLQIKITEIDCIDLLKSMLELSARSRIKSIEVILPYSDIIMDIIYSTLSPRVYPRIMAIYIYSVPFFKLEKLKFTIDKFIGINSIINCIVEDISGFENCGYIHPKYFRINIPFFTQSINYNNCLYKKLSIDKEGLIKNCLAMKKSFGYVHDNNVGKVVSSKEFQKYWFIKKDNVMICKDCEFRYMCSDCRAFTVDAKIKSKPLHCQYNPHEMSWKL